MVEEKVDFDTFCKSDFRAVKVKACEAVKKSEKLLRFTLDDGTGTDRQILSGIHKWYEPEQLVGKTVVAILNLPPRKMMGMASNGMLLSAEKDGKLEKRTVTVGTFDETYNTYEILDGLAAEDYIAFPDEQLCHNGAPTTHEMTTSENADTPMDNMGEGGMDMPMEDMPAEGMDMMPEESISGETGEMPGEDAAAAETVSTEGGVG